MLFFSDLCERDRSREYVFSRFLDLSRDYYISRTVIFEGRESRCLTEETGSKTVFRQFRQQGNCNIERNAIL